jgi:hypothetical protein
MALLLALTLPGHCKDTSMTAGAQPMCVYTAATETSSCVYTRTAQHRAARTRSNLNLFPPTHVHNTVRILP